MTTENIAENAEQPKWFIDEGIAGSGERPQWLPDKFKTVADLGKSFAELERKLGTAPDEYDLSGSKFLDKDYVPIVDALNLAKEKRVPKEVVDKLVGAVDKYMDEFSIDPEEEFKKLGDKGKERVELLDNWAKANLSDDAYKALTSTMKTAESIKALEELRGKMMSNNTVIPGSNDASNNTPQTVADLQAEISTNLEKYKTDARYREDLQKRIAIAAKTSNYVDKSGF